MSHNQLDYANDELSLSLSTNARTDVGLVVICFGGRRPGKTCRSTSLQGDPSARGLGYVDINSVSYRGYPEMEMMSA